MKSLLYKNAFYKQTLLTTTFIFLIQRMNNDGK